MLRFDSCPIPENLAANLTLINSILFYVSMSHIQLTVLISRRWHLRVQYTQIIQQNLSNPQTLIWFSKNGKLFQGSSVNATDQIFMFKTVASLTITLRSETLRPSTGEIEGVLLLAQHLTLAWDLWNKKFHKFAAGKND